MSRVQGRVLPGSVFQRSVFSGRVEGSRVSSHGRISKGGPFCVKRSAVSWLLRVPEESRRVDICFCVLLDCKVTHFAAADVNQLDEIEILHWNLSWWGYCLDPLMQERPHTSFGGTEEGTAAALNLADLLCCSAWFVWIYFGHLQKIVDRDEKQ